MTESRTNLSPLGSSGPEAMADPTPGENDVLGNSKPRSVWNDAWDSLERNPLFWISVTLIVVFLVMAAVPAIFTSKDPTDCNLSAARHIPSAVHWFGTDIQGCDVYSRTVYGARSSILVGVLATLGTTILGAFIGLVAGFRGGWLDTLLSRTGDWRTCWVIIFLLAIACLMWMSWAIRGLKLDARNRTPVTVDG